MHRRLKGERLRATETFQGLVASDDVAEAPVISPSELQVEMPESEHATANDVNAVRRSLSVSRLAIKRSKGSRVNDSFGNNEVAKATAVTKISRRVVIATPYWKPEGLSGDPPRANAREALETAFTLIDAGVLPEEDQVARRQTLPNDDPANDAGGEAGAVQMRSDRARRVLSSQEQEQRRVSSEKR